MSSIYVLEPPTQGKVVVTTTLGDLDIELWPREAPKAVRNFVQLCLEGYYDKTIFHRIITGFMVQGGDPTGSGTGGESIYGEPFKDEFHSRLRFSHRGLVACANAGAPHSNGSQWFFTLDRCDWLDKKHTIFGKITGDTIFNAVRLGEVDTDDNDRPFDPPSIISVEVIWNPFEDIVPRTLPARQQQETVAKSRGRDKEKRRQQQSEVKGTKQLNLLSFGEEAEEEEAQLEEANLRMRSSHDVLKDPRLLAAELEIEGKGKWARVYWGGTQVEGAQLEEGNVRMRSSRDVLKDPRLLAGCRKGEEMVGKRGNKVGSVGPEEVRGRDRGGREESGDEGEEEGEGEEASFDELMRRRVLEKQRRFGKHGGASEGGRRGEKAGRGGVGDGGEREGKSATRSQDGAGTGEQAQGGRAKEERAKKEEDDEDGSGDSDGSDGSDEEGGRGGKGRVRVEKLRLRKGAKGVGKGGGEGGGGGGSAGGGLLGEEEERRQQMRQRKRALGSRQEKTLELLNRFKSKLAASKTVQPREARRDEDKEEVADEGRADRRDREREGSNSKEGSRKRGSVGSEGKGPRAAAYGLGGKARQDVGGEGEEEEDEEGGGVDWMAHRLKFEVKRNKRISIKGIQHAAKKYAVHDPLLDHIAPYSLPSSPLLSSLSLCRLCTPPARPIRARCLITMIQDALPDQINPHLHTLLFFSAHPISACCVFPLPHPLQDEMLRNDDPDQYAVHDPLLEKGKEKFNKMQAKMKKRNREWAGRSLD
ncbi:unnamed protein product [Closterium sp. Naga37s-1]|nr:unnamed protein product [Closterium sp. Naga37s-1]